MVIVAIIAPTIAIMGARIKTAIKHPNISNDFMKVMKLYALSELLN